MSRSILDVNLFLLCVCVCMCVCVWVGVFSHPFSGASESFIVTPNLTQQDKMLPSALLFSALSLSSHSLSPFFFFCFRLEEKGFTVVAAEL